MRKPFFFSILCLFICQLGCVPPVEEKITDININSKDPLFRVIYDLQDRQQLDSLYAFFKHADPTYRYLAATAFGSIRKAEAIDSLEKLLQDEVPEVRAAAAYALGQIGDARAETLLIKAFERTDTAGVYRKANRAILEAVGKCGNPDNLKMLATISTYQPKDTALLEGQAWGIYRYALRNIIALEGTERMLYLSANTAYPESVRFIAANYLSRAQQLQLDSVLVEPLNEVIRTEANPNIRMALAIALGKARTETALQTLLNLYEKESDYRVKCNILRALGNYNYERTQTLAMNALRDPQLHVATRAAQFFLENGIAEDATLYWRTAKDSLPWQVQLELYAATLRHLPPTFESYRSTINNELRRRFAQATSPYHKAATLRALGEWGWNFRFIQREGFAAEHPAVRTASVETLANLCRKGTYGRFFGSSTVVAKEISIYFRQAIDSGDPAMIAIAAEALRIPERNFKSHLDSLDFLDKALAKLSLPREIETYKELRETIDFLRGKPNNTVQLDFNHPIDWQTFNALGPEPKATIRTKRGDITLRLLQDVAPGSVVNFVRLAKEGFYENKNFHRVVANFVVQGGCPRGDGYGSLDYSIRSELPQVYYDREGYVGMASAGNHTECTQFFITHAPAPHLDGNYTIFARVTQGMDVVHQIRPGDVIEKVLIQ